MSRYVCAVCLAIVTLLPMTGCPPISGLPVVMLGEWAFDLSATPGMLINIILKSGGMTEDAPGDPSFNGTLTWMQVDDVFTMTQETTGGDEYVYTGTVFGNTYLEGTFEQTVGGVFTGTWAASFVP